MILYTLRCAHEHHFEQWFDNSGDYTAKKESGELVCPECGDKDVGKAIMAPNVKGSGQDKSPPPAPSCGSPMGCGGCQFAGQH